MKISILVFFFRRRKANRNLIFQSLFLEYFILIKFKNLKTYVNNMNQTYSV